MGADNATAIGTLVDRCSRTIKLLHLPDGHSPEQVRDQMIAAVAGMPEALKLSITWDQGSEMHQHRAITEATGVQVYFCDPHSPWQRPTNENTNGLLRQYFPKGTDLSVHSRADLDHVEWLLNGRPRTCSSVSHGSRGRARPGSPPPPRPSNSSQARATGRRRSGCRVPRKFRRRRVCRRRRHRRPPRHVWGSRHRHQDQPAGRLRRGDRAAAPGSDPREPGPAGPQPGLVDKLAARRASRRWRWTPCRASRAPRRSTCCPRWPTSPATAR
jgi:hypothetical protein